MAKDAALRITAPVELMKEPEHLQMFKASVKGGMTSVFETPYFKKINRYLTGFKPEEPSTFGFSEHANILYGGVMQEDFRHIGNFRFPNEISIIEILIMPINPTIGYFVELDIEHQSSFHDQHKDYPLAPLKEIVSDAWLSEFQIDI